MEKSGITSYAFHPEAEDEFIEAVNFYNARQENLGYDFSVEVYATIRIVMAQPKAWQILKGSIRRALVNRFPYGIIYKISKQQIIILAVMHLHREPNYWKKRNS
ncbi:MAG: type II toxin-antitoxin system RelE/ParE family toxin [Bacteroidetes bacterium]|nr:type II toxin-antitoxin system RelE/ParE family toxin [Bacteroidota bacterium]